VDLEGRKVLLCEDNALNAGIAGVLMEDFGGVMELAENGQMGVDKFAASAIGEYVLILMDLRMPVLDGYGASRAIRKLDRDDAGTMPIIALSADAYEVDAKACLEAGMNAHAAKPGDANQLARFIAACVKV